MALAAPVALLQSSNDPLAAARRVRDAGRVMLAADTLGATRWQQIRLVLIPQALRTVVPPTTNQYLNLIKNSSLAVAVGYPDLVSISATSLN